MPTYSDDYQRSLTFLAQPKVHSTLKEIKHGVEREALRVTPEGGLAYTQHPETLGATLTHAHITTDFSESLMEFITPPETNINTTIGQLGDIHKFVYEQIGDEQLWPLSMPCFVQTERAIPIARYGSSNLAKMKEVYRQGLHNRYGSMMQVIAGVHFNFSLPDSFWQQWCEHKGEAFTEQNVSHQYFSMIRNFRRLSWLIPYLYGASPALCSSFLGNKSTDLPFKKLGKGTLYLPYATSLRMSDLGYTNPEQAELNICYNDLPNYVASVRRAINTKSARYANIPSGENNDWQQLNSNVLQIENELYSPIRPKQVAKSLEKPSDALENRGVSYIEVRALDVNPFTWLGIEASQFYFLDVFLLYCLLQDSPSYDATVEGENHHNLTSVVLEGRKPGLMLQANQEGIALVDWASELFEQFIIIARELDSANQCADFSRAVNAEFDKVRDPSLTPSAKWLQKLQQNVQDNGSAGQQLAADYREQASKWDYSHMHADYLADLASQSLSARKKIEDSEQVPFSDFIATYFAQKKA